MTVRQARELQAWIDARRRYGLSHAHVQMARELALDPKRLGEMASGPGAQRMTLAACLEKLYVNRFGKTRPDRVVPLEQIAPAPSRNHPAQGVRSLPQRQARTSSHQDAVEQRPPVSAVALPLQTGAASSQSSQASPHALSRTDLEAFRPIEFHRLGIALMSYTGQGALGRPGAACIVPASSESAEEQFCSCQLPANGKDRHVDQAPSSAVAGRPGQTIANGKGPRSRRPPALASCPHIPKACEILRYLQQRYGEAGLDGVFRASSWYRLFSALIDSSTVEAASVVLVLPTKTDLSAISVLDASGEELVTYESRREDSGRFLERFRRSGVPEAPTRADALALLIAKTRTLAEQQMAFHGARTRRQVGEESFWFRLAYHGFREFGDATPESRAAVDLHSGAFRVSVRPRGSDRDILHVTIPRLQVEAFLAVSGDMLAHEHGIPIDPRPAQFVLKADKAQATDGVEVELAIRVMQDNGDVRLFPNSGLQLYRYGELTYVPDLGRLVRVTPPTDLPAKYRTLTRTTVATCDIPSFLEDLAGAPSARRSVGSPLVVGLGTLSHFDRIELSVEALDRDWCWLSIDYGAGNTRIALAELLAARERGQRFMPTDAGWIDTQAPEIASLAAYAERLSPSEFEGIGKDGLKVSRMELLRFNATASTEIRVAEGKRSGDKQTMDRLLELRPARELEPLRGLKSSLRDYQRIGVEWLLFLQDNGLGGLLCDDMGLGKTHQTLALLVALREQRGETAPCLVVCPATVLPHWERLVRVHAPELGAVLYYGDGRDLAKVIGEHRLVLTSYGVLRNDIDSISKVAFAVVVFDEIQILKNHETQAHVAARRIVAHTRIGLTGTPVENRPSDLWALFEIVLPGYLGPLAAFEQRHGVGLDAADGDVGRAPLARVVSPFTLRRRKATVLTELPPKIEDLRLCRLSSDQIKLYRDAIRTRGAPFRTALQDESRPIPYVHIFTLLDQLKRICAHPMLVASSGADGETLSSGKWDLFLEILDESLGSQQKVVVFSQFLGMIDMMATHLQSKGIGHVVLTGASRDRGEIVRRFNEDPDCRVFVGSLKAGGVGIDLVAASVVIHYDRWWNAAKEDQATDRVHRMGQRRGVQVFKLVAEGTLEEKIAALIDKKRALTEKLVEEDSPDLLKTFGRQELLDLLQLEESDGQPGANLALDAAPNGRA